MSLVNVNTLIVAFIVLSINILPALIIIFKEKRDIGSTWAWLLVLLFMPIIGFLIYLFFGRQLKQKNFYNTSTRWRDFLQSKVNKQITALKHNNYFGNLTLKKYSKLIMMNLRSSNALVTTDNEVVVFNNGPEKFNALFRDIRAARTEINIQYYIIKHDSLGAKLLDELTEKARVGVKVRVLYDEIGSRGIPRSFFDNLISNGGEVAVFFPSFLKLVNFHLNNRNHRKLCIIDGGIAYIGGFNIGNEYLGLDKKIGNWRDTHLKIKGESVNHIQLSFILDWYKAQNHPKPEFEKHSFLKEKHKGNSPVQIISSGPNSETEHIKNMFIELIMSAKHSIYIQTPYFIPDPSLMDACKISLLAGIDMRILIPSKGNNPLVHWATLAYVGELLVHGAKILLYEEGFLHSKTIVVDQDVASVGSTNLDIRSFKLNFEVNAIIYDKKVAQRLHQLFLEDSRMSSELTIEDYRKRSIQSKCKEAVSRLFSLVL
ncbi:cardiolipin synthase [Virgibacillus sediminis]|uniref:Cardiolipin synthase n=1 Tax=Virgibacillus sediminis TaxID=202260 RepID=A0ABV7A1Y9_9BACI